MTERYINAYDLAETIENLDITVAGKPARWNDAKYTVLKEIAEAPDADVVPRAEVERLEQILNSYALQYGTVKDQQEAIDKIKRETSREIFAEIQEDCFDQFGYFEYEAFIKLKQKYTEGEK